MKLVADQEGEHRDQMKTKFGVTFGQPTVQQRDAFRKQVENAVPSFESKGLWPAGVYARVIAAQK
jgi:hypothetical protein